MPSPPPAAFALQVRARFGRHAADYDGEAQLQQAVAWRLAGLCQPLPLPPGPCADLGAGSGLLSRALLARCPPLATRSPLQLDLCPELLARNPLPRRRPWDLNTGLPPELSGAALLASSFALQWLEQPALALGHWCRQLGPGGWLALALPTAGSFPQWHQAAQAAGVPCTALPLPRAGDLRAVACREGLILHEARVRRFSRARGGALESLRALQRLGATASRSLPLNPGELRRLLRHWPAGPPLTWEVLLLLARRPADSSQPTGGHDTMRADAVSNRCAW
jgi:malonyl-CoA O-methyltransferase